MNVARYAKNNRNRLSLLGLAPFASASDRGVKGGQVDPQNQVTEIRDAFGLLSTQSTGVAHNGE